MQGADALIGKIQQRKAADSLISKIKARQQATQQPVADAAPQPKSYTTLGVPASPGLSTQSSTPFFTSAGDVLKSGARSVLEGTSSVLQGVHESMTGRRSPNFEPDAALSILGLEGQPESQLGQAASMVGGSAFPILMGAASGGASTAVTAAGFGAQGAAQGYYEATARGADETTRVQNMLLQGGLASGTALALTPKVLGPLTKGLGAVDRITAGGVGKSILREAVEAGAVSAGVGAGQQALSMEIHKALDIASPEEQKSLLANFGEALAQGGVPMFLSGAIMAGAGAWLQKQRAQAQNQPQSKSPSDSAPQGLDPNVKPLNEQLAPRTEQPVTSDSNTPGPAVSAANAPQGSEAAPEFVPSVQTPRETVLQRVQRAFQDDLNRLTVVNKVEEARSGAPVKDSQDIRLGAELRRGKTSLALDEVQSGYARRIEKIAGEAQIPDSEIGDFLYAVGASKRDRTIAARTGGQVANGSGWDPAVHGGMTADQYARAALNSPKGQAFARIRTLNRLFNKRKLDVMVESQLISPETRQQWVKDFGQDYVPAKTFESVDPLLENEVTPGVGKGLAITGPEAIKAMGRSTEADNPLAFQYKDLQRTMVRAGKNKAMLRAAEFAKAKPEYGWRSIPADQADMSDPLNIPYRENGVRMALRVNDSLLARQLRSAGDKEVGPILRNITNVGRAATQLYTRFDPDFIVANVERDIQNATAYLGAEKGADFTKGVLQRVKSGEPYKAAYRYERDNKAAGKYEQYRRDLAEDGGLVSSYRTLDFEGAAKDLARLRAEEVPGTPIEKGLAKARTIGKWWDAVTGSTEIGTRLAVYAEARERGVSRERAAQLAKNVTLNFELKGEWGPALNALYPFFRVGASGTARTLQLMSSKRGRRIGYAVAATGAMLSEMNRLVGGEDEDGIPLVDKIDPDRRDRDMIFMVPPSIADSVDLPGVETDPSGARFMSLPKGQGFVSMWMTLGENADAAARNMRDPRQGKPLREAIENTAGFALRAADPLSGSTLLQHVSPWITDPIAEQLDNKTFAGTPHHPTPFPGDTSPKSGQAFDSTSDVAKSIAKGLNKVSGGSDYRSGAVDIYPATIEGYMRQMTGGPGRFFSNALAMARAAMEGGDAKISQVPIARRFVGESGEAYDWREYYKLREEIATQVAEYKGTGEVGDLAPLKRALDKTQERLSLLSKKADAATTPEEKRSIRADRLAVVRGFLKAAHGVEFGPTPQKR